MKLMTASMRPRLKAAENAPHRHRHIVDRPASMRPRLKAAENITRGCTSPASTPGFNEAAA